jgi:hypothetical protein
MRGQDKVDMHLNFPFDSRQVLWTLTLAAQLVLLVVLLGRDRMRRYPWFTAATALFALQLMAEVLLSGRMAILPMQVTFLALADLTAIVGLLVLVEVAYQAFAGASRSIWIAYTLGLLVAAAGVLAVWGPWPERSSLDLSSIPGRLQIMQLVARKGDLLVGLLTVGLGFLVVVWGRRFKGGWRSHAQQIVIGLSAVSIIGLALQGTLQYLFKTVHTREEYTHAMALIAKILTAKQVVYIAALVWWIVWLWLDEPGIKADEQQQGVE